MLFCFVLFISGIATAPKTVPGKQQWQVITTWAKCVGSTISTYASSHSPAEPPGVPEGYLSVPRLGRPDGRLHRTVLATLSTPSNTMEGERGPGLFIRRRRGQFNPTAAPTAPGPLCPGRSTQKPALHASPWGATLAGSAPELPAENSGDVGLAAPFGSCLIALTSRATSMEKARSGPAVPPGGGAGRCAGAGGLSGRGPCPTARQGACSRHGPAHTFARKMPASARAGRAGDGRKVPSQLNLIKLPLREPATFP